MMSPRSTPRNRRAPSVRIHCIQAELAAGARHAQSDFLAVSDEKGRPSRPDYRNKHACNGGCEGQGRSLAVCGLEFFFVFLVFVVGLQVWPVDQKVTGDLETAGLPEPDPSNVASGNGGAHIMASPGMQKRDHRLGHPLSVPLAAELGVHEELGHHPLHALRIGRLRSQNGDNETHPAVLRYGPPDMSVLALL